jgi:hypothetical protein
VAFDDYELSASKGSKVYLYLFRSYDDTYEWAYTDAPEPVTVGLVTYQPETISHDEPKASSSAENPDRLTIRLPFENPVVSLHRPYLPPRPVKVRVYSYQRRDMTLELRQEFYGTVSTFAERDSHTDLVCNPILDSLQQNVPWMVHKAGCVWATYSEACGLNAEDWMTPAVVQSFASTTIQAPEFATKPDQWFRGGYIKNDATGEARFITDHVGDLIKVIYPFIGLANGTALKAYAGDDHNPETCRIKFNNKLNYLGFDFFPDYNIFQHGTGHGRGGTATGGGASGGAGNNGNGELWPTSEA